MPYLFPALDTVVTAAPGTGSTSLERACRTAGGAVDLAPAIAAVDQRIEAKHLTWSRTMQLCGLEDVEHVVTTTRDPFDFHYAEWYRTRTRWAPERDDPRSWVHDVPGVMASIERACTSSFAEWVVSELGSCVESGEQRRLNRGHVDEASLVLRMERMDDDLARWLPDLAERLGSIPFVNRTDRVRDLPEVYDDRSVALVMAAHRGDIELFGYAPPR